MSKKNYLTKEGYEKLIEELRYLKKTKLPKVIEILKDAMSQWDLSENSDYHAAMLEKDLVNNRIAEVEASLKDVQLIEEDGVKDTVVGYGSKVLIENEEKEKFSLVIVGTWEVDYEWGVSKEGNVAIDFSEGINISFESPIGIAIRGKKEGEVARVRIGNQRKEVKILKIQ